MGIRFVQVSKDVSTGGLPRELTRAPATRQVKFASFQYKGKNVHLIDTPVLDDIFGSNANVLQEIADWLRTYGYDIRLSGIIHLHQISSARMTDPAIRQLRFLSKIWGPSMLPSVAMVTTMWDNTDPKIGAARERELKSIFWLPLLERGNIYCRLDNSRGSALLIIETFMTKVRGRVQFQHEMVDQHEKLKDTGAGQRVERRAKSTVARDLASS